MSGRLDGWEARLAGVIEAARFRPYQWGAHDCFRLTCQAVDALTGVDRWPEFAGYTSRREALERLAGHGSFDLAFDWFFGAPAVNVRQARRGDICALQTPDGQKHLGVCLGADVACIGAAGLDFVPTLTCLCCWRVA